MADVLKEKPSNQSSDRTSRKKKIHKKKDTPFLTHEELKRKLEIFQTLSSTKDVQEESVAEEFEVNQTFQETFEKFNERGLRYYKDNVLKSDEEEDNKEDDQKKQEPEKIVEVKEKSKKMSRKKEKEFFKTKLSQLKVVVDRPDLVESWDVTAPDPLLLIHLKSIRSSIAVPKHWSQKKRFLQSKRGSFKRPFRLPDFIEATGISKLRDPLSEVSGLKMIRQKLKERMNPTLGKIDIDYQTLHDAFFKYQTKPKMTQFGDIFYEGKEEDQKMRAYRPGKLSSDLRAALGISETAPVPWLLNMHKYGPPPSYPNMKLSGFNLDSFRKAMNVNNNNTKKVEEDNDDWEWVNENYLFGAVQDEKLDDEEIGFEIENQANDNEDIAVHQLNQDNPYFMLESFMPEAHEEAQEN